MLNTLTFKFDIPDSLLPAEDIVTLDWGYLTGDINKQTDLVNLIDKKVTDSSAVIYNKIKDISTDINNINGRVDTLNDRLTQKVNSTDFENYQLSVYTKEEVYTKTETDSQINAAKPDLEPYAKKTDIPEMPDLSLYAKKTDIPNTSQFVTNTSVNANYSKIGHTHSQYLTEHQSLADYVTNTSVNANYSKIGHKHPEYLTEHQSLEDYATKDYVNNHVPEIDTTSIDSSISDISTRLNTLTYNFNTLVGNEEAVNGTINTFKEMESFLQDISDASTLTGLMETEHKKLEDKIDNINVPTKTSELENNSGFITVDDIPEMPDLSHYVTDSSVEDNYSKIGHTHSQYLTESDLESLDDVYAAKNHTHEQYALKEDVAGLETRLETRLAVDMSNIDAAGEQKIKDIVGPIPEAPDLTLYAKTSDLSVYATTSSLSNYINKTYTVTNVIKGKFQVGEYTDNISNAYLHIRNVGSNSITGYNVNGACFTVNGDGTASFQHKTYADNGTGAKNSAILRFSNKGIQFAVNSGTGSSPTEDMYNELATLSYVDSKLGKEFDHTDMIKINRNYGISTAAPEIDDPTTDSPLKFWNGSIWEQIEPESIGLASASAIGNIKTILESI